MASRHRLFSLREIECLQSNDFSAENGGTCEGAIDIVEIPPDRVDEVSDNEELDDNILTDTEPTDVPGYVEIQRRHTGNGAMDTTEEPSLGRKRKKHSEPGKKPRHDRVKWAKVHPTYTNVYPNASYVDGKKNNMLRKIEGKSPLEIFEMIFNETIITNIVRQTLLYAQQKNAHNFQFSNDCFKKFMGILLFTGYYCLPQEQYYWSEDVDLNVKCVRKCMSFKRYQEIKRYLHFNNNSNIFLQEREDKLFKIRSLIDQLNRSFMQFGVFSHNLTIGEQMVRYYGRHYMYQYLRTSPIRFGFKQWSMCDSQTGYCYQMQVYDGQPSGPQDKLSLDGFGTVPVLNMISQLERPGAHKVYFDSFFTGYTLIKRLHEMNVRATGPVLVNKMNNCPIKTDKDMIFTQRGTYDYRFDPANEVLAVTWNDKVCVRILTNHGHVHPLNKVRRWKRAEGRDIVICQPNLIGDYDENKSGVSRMDAAVRQYRIRIRGKKWYFPLITNAIDVAVVNAHILYCLANGPISLLDFKRVIATAYLFESSEHSDPKRGGNSSLAKSSFDRVPRDVRLSGTHYIERTPEGKQRKCAVCKKNARKQCAKCNIGLHINCFREWHQG